MKKISQKIFIITIVLFASACSSSKNKSKNSDLTNSVWNFIDFEKEYVITFSKNKKFHTTDSADTTPNNEEWLQSNNEVKFYFNNRYAQYDGKIFKDSIVGFGKNKDTIWSFKMTRKR